MSKARKFAEIRDGKTDKVLVQMFAPAAEEDAFSIGLRVLTYALKQRTLEGTYYGGGLFGGTNGYGVAFENDVFMMHPYCWCERPECLWCCIWLSNEVQGCPEADAEAHRAKQTQQVRELYGEWAAAYPGAPHFWHKPSGLQARWYKYIGRDNEVSGAIPAARDIFEECLASIGAPPLKDSLPAMVSAEEESARQFAERLPDMMVAIQALDEAQTPCWSCSERGFGAGGGCFEGGPHGTVARTLHENNDANDPCRNCGHVNTSEQVAALSERQRLNHADMRRRLRVEG